MYRNTITKARLALIMFYVFTALETIVIGYIIFTSIAPENAFALNQNFIFLKSLTWLSRFIMVMFLATVVFFIIWFYSSYSGLHRIGIDYLKYNPIWAVFSWFIPVFNLFAPYNIMKEVWEESHLLAHPKEKRYKVDTNYTLINIWWFLLMARVVLIFLSRLMFGRIQHTSNPGEFFGWINILELMLIFTASITTILIIRKLASLNKDVNTPKDMVYENLVMS